MRTHLPWYCQHPSSNNSLRQPLPLPPTSISFPSSASSPGLHVLDAGHCSSPSSTFLLFLKPRHSPPQVLHADTQFYQSRESIQGENLSGPFNTGAWRTAQMVMNGFLMKGSWTNGKAFLMYISSQSFAMGPLGFVKYFQLATVMDGLQYVYIEQ